MSFCCHFRDFLLFLLVRATPSNFLLLLPIGSTLALAHSHTYNAHAHTQTRARAQTLSNTLSSLMVTMTAATAGEGKSAPRTEKSAKKSQNRSRKSLDKKETGPRTFRGASSSRSSPTKNPLRFSDEISRRPRARNEINRKWQESENNGAPSSTPRNPHNLHRIPRNSEIQPGWQSRRPGVVLRHTKNVLFYTRWLLRFFLPAGWPV